MRSGALPLFAGATVALLACAPIEVPGPYRAGAHLSLQVVALPRAVLDTVSSFEARLFVDGSLTATVPVDITWSEGSRDLAWLDTPPPSRTPACWRWS